MEKQQEPKIQLPVPNPHGEDNHAVPDGWPDDSYIISEEIPEMVQEPIPKREIIWDMEDDDVPQDNEWDETYDEDEYE